jgi:hypothetical protein
MCLPDELWVGDQYAYALARETFPNSQVRLIENPYFKYFLKEYEKTNRLINVSSKNNANVLFVCENINRKEFHQNDAIRFFMSNLDNLGLKNPHILIRPHPSEEGSKYLWACKEFGCHVNISSGKPLLDEIVESDIVAGCASMAMVLGLLAKRRVISCIPSKDVPLTLPFKEIELLSNLIKLNG